MDFDGDLNIIHTCSKRQVGIIIDDLLCGWNVGFIVDYYGADAERPEEDEWANVADDSN